MQRNYSLYFLIFKSSEVVSYLLWFGISSLIIFFFYSYRFGSLSIISFLISVIYVFLLYYFEFFGTITHGSSFYVTPLIYSFSVCAIGILVLSTYFGISIHSYVHKFTIKNKIERKKHDQLPNMEKSKIIKADLLTPFKKKLTKKKKRRRNEERSSKDSGFLQFEKFNKSYGMDNDSDSDSDRMSINSNKSSFDSTYDGYGNFRNKMFKERHVHSTFFSKDDRRGGRDTYGRMNKKMFIVNFVVIPCVLFLSIVCIGFFYIVVDVIISENFDTDKSSEFLWSLIKSYVEIIIWTFCLIIYCFLISKEVIKHFNKKKKKKKLSEHIKLIGMSFKQETPQQHLLWGILESFSYFSLFLLALIVLAVMFQFSSMILFFFRLFIDQAYHSVTMDWAICAINFATNVFLLVPLFSLFARLFKQSRDRRKKLKKLKNTESFKYTLSETSDTDDDSDVANIEINFDPDQIEETEENGKVSDFMMGTSF